MAYTKRAVEVFEPTTVGGQPRSVDNGDAQVWGTEVEALIDNFDPSVIDNIQSDISDLQGDVSDLQGDVNDILTGSDAGTKWTNPVHVATTANITLSGTQTIDGYALSVGNRVLVKDQTNPAQNGIYTVASGAWPRSTDADTSSELTRLGALVFYGTLNAGRQYVQTTNMPTVGSSPVVWVIIGNADDVSGELSEIQQDLIYAIGPDDRPGAAPSKFLSGIVTTEGGPETGTPIDIGDVAVSSYGPVIRGVNATKAVFERWPWRVERGRIYRLRFGFTRVVNAADPSIAFIRYGVRFSDKDYTEVGTSAVTVSNFTTSNGRTVYEMIVGVDVDIPATAVHARAYAQMQGNGTTGTHTTDIEIVGHEDITETDGVVQEVVDVFSGRMTWGGDSLAGSYYVVPNKGFLPVVASLSDWQIDNYGYTGRDAIEGVQHILSGFPIYHPTLSLRDMRPQYFIAWDFGNSSYLYANSTRAWVEAMRRYIDAGRAVGATPIYLSEGLTFKGTDLAALSTMLEETGVRNWEITGEYFLQARAYTEQPHYYFPIGGRHPGTRMTSMYAWPITRRIADLGRPRTSMKMFRPRPLREQFGAVLVYPFRSASYAAWPSATYNGSPVGTASAAVEPMLGGRTVYNSQTEGDRMTFGGSFALPQSYTIIAQVKPNAFSGGSGSQAIVANLTSGVFAFILNAQNIVVAHGSTTYINVAATKVATNRYTWLALTYDADRQILRLYEDGELLASVGSVPNHSATQPQLGAGGTGVGSTFVGRVGYLGFWDKPLLPWQVQAISAQRDGLTFEDNFDRHAYWQEVRIGHAALVEDTQPHFDRGDELSPATYEHLVSDYLNMQSGAGVAFHDKAMIQFVVPGQGASTRGLVLTFKGADDASVYMMSPTLALAGNAFDKHQGFVTSAYPVGLEAGATYTFSGVTYTHVTTTPFHDGAGWVAWFSRTGEPSQVDLGAGTLTRVTGSGPNSFGFTQTICFNHGANYAQMDRPYYTWASVANNGGVVRVRPSDQFSFLTPRDKVVFLIEKDGAFTLRDVKLRWVGVPGKDTTAPMYPVERDGDELLAAQTVSPGDFGTGKWVAVGGTTPIEPDDNVTPPNVTHAVNLNMSDAITQEFTLTADARLRKRVQVVVGGRYAPPRQSTVSSDVAVAKYNFQNRSPITPWSADMGVCYVQIDNSAGDTMFSITKKVHLPLGPSDVVFTFDIPNAAVWDDDNCTIRVSGRSLYGDDDDVQIYRVSVKDLGVIQ